MAWRGEDQFPLILTSDGSMDIYPENRTSQFKVLLNSPIETGEEDWEVCLQSINYPYSWANVGPAAKVYMKYYIDNRSGEKVLEFPNWQCEKLSEVIDFMRAKISSQGILKGTDTPKLYVGVDELGRFKLECNSSEFDVGFSRNMMKLLGLSGHKYAKLLTIEEFDRRQRHRELIDKIVRKDVLFPMSELHGKILECKTGTELSEILKPYIVWQELNDVSNEQFLEVRKNSESYSGAWWIDRLMTDLKILAEEPYIPSALRGVIPCSLNPVQRMYIYCNIVEPIGINEKAVRLLKLVNTQGSSYKTVQEDYPYPMYLPVQKGKISMIEVLIADESGDPVPFQIGTSVLTLHFRRAIRRYRPR